MKHIEEQIAVLDRQWQSHKGTILESDGWWIRNARDTMQAMLDVVADHEKIPKEIRRVFVDDEALDKLKAE